jgi:glycosyltransferase involved in cell wall biosynthesis
VTGVQRYAEELLRALDREVETTVPGIQKHAFQMLVPRPAATWPAFKHITVRQVGRLQGHAWEQLELPWYARSGLLLSLANTGPVLKRRQIVTIHDASIFAVPEAYSVGFRWWYRALLPKLGRAASRVVTDSEFSRAELVRYANIPEEKIRVIPLGCEHIRSRAPECGILTRLGLRSHAYLLAVGSQSPHKNLGMLAQALEHLPDLQLNCVVAGASNPKVFERPSPMSAPKLTMPGYVSDSELRALYEHAACFVYPSLYEGFGLPPLEAMSCGCPVVVSSAASLPSVCGDAAIYCDPRSSVSVAEAVRQVVSDRALQDRLRVLGRQQASKFTWPASARAFLALIHEVAAACE